MLMPLILLGLASKFVSFVQRKGSNWLCKREVTETFFSNYYSLPTKQHKNFAVYLWIILYIIIMNESMIWMCIGYREWMRRMAQKNNACKKNCLLYYYWLQLPVQCSAIIIIATIIHKGDWSASWLLCYSCITQMSGIWLVCRVLG